jgi:hypothetical protein
MGTGEGEEMVKNERTEIRQELRKVLEGFSREELLAQLFYLPWGRTDEFKDYEKMRHVQIESACMSDEQLIKKILDRDVEKTYKFRHSRV